MIGTRKTSIRAFRTLYALAALAVACPQITEAAEPVFYSQCRKLLPIADDFANECLKHARPFSRTFYPSGGSRGELESYSTYFKTLDAPSHFVLGCVLNFQHRISFEGLYYLARPSNMAHFDDYRIIFVDPNDNVGLEIDGVQNTLIAVRQFGTEVVPLHFSRAVKNCEASGLETIGDAVATATLGEHFRKLDDSHVEYCIGDSCKIHPYSVFFGSHQTPIVYAFNWLFLIDADGVLMLEEDYHKQACATWTVKSAGMYNIIVEMCPNRLTPRTP